MHCHVLTLLTIFVILPDEEKSETRSSNKQRLKCLCFHSPIKKSKLVKNLSILCFFDDGH